MTAPSLTLDAARPAVSDSPPADDRAYSLESSCRGGTLHDRDLDVSVWTHNGTAWVALAGQLTERAVGSLAQMLLSDPRVLGVVINIAELSCGSNEDRLLLRMCADLGAGGRSVTMIGPDTD